jgi:hypothetical protein
MGHWRFFDTLRSYSVVRYSGSDYGSNGGWDVYSAAALI